MKINKFYLIGFLLFLFGCSEEEPSIIGNIGLTYTITCTPQTASIVVTESAETHIYEAYDYPYFFCSDTIVNMETLNKPALIDDLFQVMFSRIYHESSNQKNSKFFFTDKLSPDTQYYLYDKYWVAFKYLGSFKTPKEGDFSELGEAKIDIDEYQSIDDKFVKDILFKITLPEHVVCYNNFDYVLSASLKEDMSDAEIIGSPVRINDISNEIYFKVDELRKGKYFYEFRGEVALYAGEIHFNWNGEEYFSGIKNAIIKVENSIDLSDLK